MRITTKERGTAGSRATVASHQGNGIIALPRQYKRPDVKLFDVVYLEGDGNYTQFHLTNSQRVTVAITLAKYDTLPGFLRIHKSHAVNLIHLVDIVVYNAKNAYVRLTSGVQLLIARRRIAQVIQELENRLTRNEPATQFIAHVNLGSRVRTRKKGVSK